MMRRTVCLLTIALYFCSFLPAAKAAAGDDLQLVRLAMAGDRDGVRALLKKKVDVNVAQGDGMTALHWAVYKDDAELARALIQAGANVKASTRSDEITPLYIAATNGNEKIIDMLLKAGSDVNGTIASGATALMQAAESGRVEAVKTLLDHGASIDAKEKVHGQTAVMFAADANRDAVIRLLASRGAGLDFTTNISVIDQYFTEAAIHTINQEKPDNSANGAAPTGGDYGGPRPVAMGGMSALLYATREGHMEATRALVESGANLNLRNPSDKISPIIEAIINGHYDLAKYLLEHGANPNLPSADGLEALYATIDNEYAPVAWSATSHTWTDGTGQQNTNYLELMELLLRYGADPNAAITNVLWFRPPHHNQMWVKTTGSTAFWRAAQATDLAAMKLLVKYGANPKTPSTQKDTPLHMAAGIGWAGNFSINAPDPRGFMESAKYLVEEVGIDVNAVDALGYTALMGAAYRGDNAVVEYLVSKSAKLDQKNDRGWSATDMALAPNIRSSVGLAHPETAALLEKLGAPKRLQVEDEEILGIIKKPAPKP